MPKASGSKRPGSASSAGKKTKLDVRSYPGRKWSFVPKKKPLQKPAWMAVVRDRLNPWETFRDFRLKMGWTATKVNELMCEHWLPKETSDRVAATLGMSSLDFRRASCAGDYSARGRARATPTSAPARGKSRDGGPHPASDRPQGPRAQRLTPHEQALEDWATELLVASGEMRPTRAKAKRRKRG